MNKISFHKPELFAESTPFSKPNLNSPSHLPVDMEEAFEEIIESKNVAYPWIAASIDPIALIGQDGRYQQINKSYQDNFSLFPEKIVGLHLEDYWGQAIFQSQMKQQFEQCLAGDTIDFKSWLHGKYGEKRYLAIRFTPLQSFHNAVNEVIMTIHDLTSTMEHQATTASLKFAIDHAMEGVALLDGNGLFGYMNPVHARMYGYERDEVIGKNWKDLYEPDQIVIIEQIYFSVLLSQGHWRGELIGLRKNGETFTVEVSLNRIPEDPMQPVRIICTCRDTTTQNQAKESLIQSEKRYRSLVEHAPFCIHQIDLDGKILSMNPAGRTLMAIKNQEEIIGHSYLDLVEERDKKRVEGYFRQACLGQSHEFHFHTAKNRKKKYFTNTFTPIKNEENQVIRIIGMAENVTKRKRIEDALKKSDAEANTQLAKLQQHQSLLQVIHQAESQFIASEDPTKIFNGFLASVLNLTQSEYGFIGEVQVTPEGDKYLKTHAITNIAWNQKTHDFYDQFASNLEFSNLKILFDEVLTTGKPVIANDPMNDSRKGGLPKGHTLMNAFLVLPIYKGKNMLGMVGVANRPNGYSSEIITDLQPLVTSCGTLIESYQNEHRRKKAEIKVREIQQRWEVAIWGTNDGMWDWPNTQMDEQWWSPHFSELLGYEDNEIKASLSQFIDLIHPEEKDQFILHVQEHLEKNVLFNTEYRLRTKSGAYQWFHVRGKTVVNDDTGQVRMAGSIQDISERKKKEEQLKTLTDRFLLATSAAKLGIWDWDIEQNILTWDSKMLDLYGLTSQSFVGAYETWKQSLYPDDRVKAEQEVHMALSGEKDLNTEFRVLWPDSSVHILGVRGLVQRDTKGNPIRMTGVNWDITEPKKIEAHRQELSRQNELILSSAGEGIFGLDTNGQTTFVNPAAARMLGYEAEELIRTPMHAIIHHTHSDGLPYPQKTCPVCAAFRDEIIHHVDDERLWRKDGTSFPVEYTSTPIRDDEGKALGAVVTFKDITERHALAQTILNQNGALEKEVTLRAQQIEELTRRSMKVEKLAALAQIAAGIAHEINNPLASIAQAMMLVKRAIPPDHSHFPYAGKIEDSITRIAHIVKQLYQLYRADTPISRTVDLGKVIQEILDIMKPLAKIKNVHLITEIPEGHFLTEASRIEVIQVLCNLIKNSLDVSEAGNHITITLSRNSPFLTTSVSDQGPGISHEVAPHIFEPFFTTKQGHTEDGGLGLGLAVCHSLVESMNGTLEFSSSVGQGTVFSLKLPEVDEMSSPPYLKSTH